MTTSASPTKKIMLSALTPSNRITLGNYIGAIKNWVEMQKQHDCLFFAVDHHALTDRTDPKQLREWTYQAIATYIASGLDPEQALIFVQSHVPAHAELSWVLTCHTNMGELSRMTQFKDKSQKHGESIPVGLFGYPVLMAADILLYHTNLVPVGADQKQHIELARDLAIRMNNLYSGKQHPLFTIPEPFIPPVGAKIMSLQDPSKKMSKSDTDPHASVFMDDSDKDIEKKFKRAVTDSGSEITDDDSKPGVKNLLTIQSALTGKKIPELVASYQGKMYGHLKVDTANLAIETIRPIREKARELLSDRGELDRILKRGANRANERAAKMLRRVYEKIGFIPAT